MNNQNDDKCWKTANGEDGKLLISEIGTKVNIIVENSSGWQYPTSGQAWLKTANTIIAMIGGNEYEFKKQQLVTEAEKIKEYIEIQKVEIEKLQKKLQEEMIEKSQKKLPDVISNDPAELKEA